MIDFLELFVHILVSPFKMQARLEAEIVLLRHQLSVLRQRVPSKPRLTVADRLLFVWFYRLFPSVLNAVTVLLEPSDEQAIHSVSGMSKSCRRRKRAVPAPSSFNSLSL